MIMEKGRIVSFLLTVFLSFTLLEMQAQGASGYNFSVEVEGMQEGTCKLIGTVGATNFLQDSAVFSAGKVTFQKSTPAHGGLYYVVFPNNYNIQVLLDTDQEFTLKTTAKDLVGGMEVSGSLDNELLYQNLKFETDFQNRFQALEGELALSLIGSNKRKELEEKRDALIQERKDHLNGFEKNHPGSFFTVFKLSGQNPDLTFPKKPNGDLDTLMQVYLYRNAYWDNTDLTDERLLYTPIIHNKLKTYINQLTDQRIDSVIKYADIVIQKALPNKEMFKFVVNWIAIKYHKSTIMGGEKIFVHLVDNYFTDELAFWSTPKELDKIRGEADEFRVSLLGMKGKNLVCPVPGNEAEKKELYALAGPVRVLYIYSYDCEHCRERTPVMKQVYDQWKDKGLDVYALCVDHDSEKLQNFITKYGIEGWTNVYDPQYASRYYKKYHVDITPEVYVFDQDWKIIAKDLHPNQLEPILKKQLK